jgi:hypothetical protein
MSLAPASPIVGAAMTGLTSPTYTVTLDSPPNSHSKQYAVTAIGGTQTGVTIHSPSSPFILMLQRPAQFKQLAQVNPVTGKLMTVPRNTWRLLVVKGGLPMADQAPANIVFRAEFAIPAGVEINDTANLAALLSFLGGLFWVDGNDLRACFTSGLLGA